MVQLTDSFCVDSAVCDTPAGQGTLSTRRTHLEVKDGMQAKSRLFMVWGADPTFRCPFKI